MNRRINILFITMIIWLIVYLVDCAPPTLITFGDMRTGQFTVSNLTTSNSSVITITYSSAIILPNNLYCSVGVIGIQSQIYPKIILNVLIFSASASQITVFIGVDSLNSMKVLSFNYFVATNYTFEMTHIISNNWNGQLNGNTTKSISIKTRSKFTFGKLYNFAYFSSLNLTSNGNMTVFSISSTQIERSGNISITIFTDHSTTLYSLTYWVLVFNSQYFQSQLGYRYLGYLGVKELSNTTIGSYINSSLVQIYSVPDRIFFAISGFIFNSLIQKNVFFNSTLYSSYASNTGTVQVTLQYFGMVFRANCPSGQFYIPSANDCRSTCTSPNLVLNYYSLCSTCHYSCLTCFQSALPTQCNTCDSTKLRQKVGQQCKCMVGYIDQGDMLCYPCKSIIVGCNYCALIDYVVYCTNCGFLVSISNGVGIVECLCNSTLSYFRNTDSVCINSSGCVTYSVVNNTYGTIGICTACNSSLNFKPTPSNITNQCECVVGSYLNGTLDSRVCLTICGDGILLVGQGCDDGNTVNGDGCSSTCSVQYQWYCQGSPSKCTKIDYSLKVMYVLRITNANKMRVALLITPNNLSFTTSSLKQYISHNIPASDYDVSYEGGYLVLDFYYFESLEGHTYSLSLNPSSVYPNIKFNTLILASGMNAMLTYDSNYSYIQTLSIMVIVLDCLALLFLVLSMCFQRLIGIEMMYTIQSVFFLMSFMQVCPSLLSPLQLLTYSNGYNYHSSNQYIRMYHQPFSLYSVGIEKQFILSFNVMLAIIGFVIFLLLVVRIVLHLETRRISKIQQSRQFLKNDKKTKQKHMKMVRKRNKTQKVFNFIFGKLFTVIVLTCLFSIVFSLSSQMMAPSLTYIQVYSNYISILTAEISMLIVVVLISLLIIDYVYPSLSILSFKHIHPLYPVYFILSSFLFILLVSLTYNTLNASYIIFVMCVVNIVVVICIKPYPSWFHNLTLLYHQLVIIFSLSLFYYAETIRWKSQNQKLMLVGCSLIIVMLYVVVICNVIRMWKWKNSHLKEQEKQEEEQYVKIVTTNKTNKLINIQQLDNNTKDFQWVYNQYEDQKPQRNQPDRNQPDRNQPDRNQPDNKLNQNIQNDEINEDQDDENQLRNIKEKLKKQLKKQGKPN